MTAGSGVSSAGGWVPAFEGQRPPFAPENALARKSGAWSARVRDPLARELLTELAEERPDVVERWPDLAADLCQVRARVHLLREWLAERGLFKGSDIRDGVLKHLPGASSRHSDSPPSLGSRQRVRPGSRATGRWPWTSPASSRRGWRPGIGVPRSPGRSPVRSRPSRWASRDPRIGCERRRAGDPHPRGANLGRTARPLESSCHARTGHPHRTRGPTGCTRRRPAGAGG